MDRIKFYSKIDLSSGYQLSRAETILRSFDSSEDVSCYTVNDIIEFYNISQFIEAELYLLSWSIDDIELFKRATRSFQSIIGKFFNMMPESDILNIYSSLDYEYVSNFWELFDKYKVYERMSAETFRTLSNDHRFILQYVLAQRRTTNFYGSTIREMLMSGEKSAEILLDEYERERKQSDNPIFFPDILSLQDKEDIMCNYIASSIPNPNYLKLIINVRNSRNSSDLAISSKTRLEAKRRLEKVQDEIFSEGSHMSMETMVSFRRDQREAVKIDRDHLDCSLLYSAEWLEENCDFNTLLNNFIYLFEYTDTHMRINLVNKQSEMGVFERFLLMRSKSEYIIGSTFNRKNQISVLQMFAYYMELERLGIRIEDIIEWFFSSYLKDEFGIIGYHASLPSKNSLYFEKCRAILPEMESVLKQFILFVKYKEIDQELLYMWSDHLFYNQIPSIIKEKYVYGSGDDFKIILHNFFSDQSSLHYIKRLEKQYKDFFELITNENITSDDYLDFHKPILEWLIDHNQIRFDENGVIRFVNKEEVIIFRDLFRNDVICFWHYPKKYRDTIISLQNRDLVYFDSLFFSRPEQDYFNYYLNKSCFSNSLDLRNMYSHGTQSGDEANHRHVYMDFLKLFILIIIKINDEFCVADSAEYKYYVNSEQKNCD